MPSSFTQALEAHTAEDHAFQRETRAFNGEMAVFKAETEGSLAALHEKMDAMLTEIKEMKATLEPISEAYNGLIFGKKLITGLAGVILGIGAIGAGIIWVVNASVHKQ